MKFEDVERARSVYHAKFKKIIRNALIVATVIGLCPFLFSLGFGKPLHSLIFAFPIWFFCAVFGLVITIFLTRKESAAYKNAYKAYFVEANLAKIFTGLTYDHTRGIDRNTIRATNMINTGDTFSSNDLATARYKDVSFVQSDATIQVEHTDSDGDTTYQTIFRGRFMFFEFPKKFSFRLELIGKKFYAYRVPGKNQTTGRKMTKINTESSDFNRHFKIYGEDGFEAFYLLDPAIMVKIEELAEHYDYRILLGFLDNTLLVAINDGEDSFEPPKFTKPLDEKTESERIGRDIKVITDFVDTLKLDRKLFK